MNELEKPNLGEALLQRMKYEQGMGLESIRPTDLEIQQAPAPSPAPSMPSNIPDDPPASKPQPITSAKARPPTLAEPEDLETRWSELDAAVQACTRCVLHSGRIQPLFGQGDRNARIVFIGGGPGREEDQKGQQLIGPTGQLFDRILKAVGWHRSEVYICNLIKCHPTKGNRVTPEIIDHCVSYLEAQLALIQPEVLIALGAPAAHALMGAKGDINALRGKWGTYSKGGQSIQIMPTYHPAYVHQNYTDANRRAIWNDMKQVKAHLEQGMS